MHCFILYITHEVGAWVTSDQIRGKTVAALLLARCVVVLSRYLLNDVLKLPCHVIESLCKCKDSLLLMLSFPLCFHCVSVSFDISRVCILWPSQEADCSYLQLMQCFPQTK